jgi:hypothetical protein
MTSVRVYVVTYRRPLLLERALRSLIAQTHQGWVAEVLNDDPLDTRADQVIQRLADARISLSQPAIHRGGTGNFNYAFRRVVEPLASILEDDNWWEPAFLATMVSALERYPNVEVACGNERIWQEQADGTWRDTETNIWPVTTSESLFHSNSLDKCGQARLCNSSLLFRTANASDWQTPAGIPIDVTEHFRERVIPHPVLLVNQPLVNYAETLVTHRSKDPSIWASYQILLLGSTFALTSERGRPILAKALWARARTAEPLFATTLLATGKLIPAAKDLWKLGRLREKVRFAAGAIRHPKTTRALLSVRRNHELEWAWLLRGNFANFMIQSGSNA